MNKTTKTLNYFSKFIKTKQYTLKAEIQAALKSAF